MFEGLIGGCPVQYNVFYVYFVLIAHRLSDIVLQSVNEIFSAIVVEMAENKSTNGVREI